MTIDENRYSQFSWWSIFIDFRYNSININIDYIDWYRLYRLSVFIDWAHRGNRSEIGFSIVLKRSRMFFTINSGWHQAKLRLFPIFPWDRRCRSLSSTGHQLVQAKLERVQNAYGGVVEGTAGYYPTASTHGRFVLPPVSVALRDKHGCPSNLRSTSTISPGIIWECEQCERINFCTTQKILK